VELEAVLPEKLIGSPLVEQALTHSSYVSDPLKSNERLEFLGDAVLGLLVADILYERFPEMEEGSLTKMRSQLVSRQSLVKVGKELGLLTKIKVGQRDAKSPVLAANAVEALVGAVYLGLGLEAAKEFVLLLLGDKIDKAGSDQVHGDYKSLLHQSLVKAHMDPPKYQVSWTGPDHRRWYKVEVEIAGGISAVGEGRSIKIAEQDACRRLVLTIHKSSNGSDA
jgi:ribonuclease-3